MTPYQLTSEMMMFQGVKLYRIELTEDCRWGSAGDKGGWIQSESNLTGDAWVSKEGKVFNLAQIRGTAEITGNAIIKEHAQIYGKAKISKFAIIGGWTSIGGEAVISGFSFISGKTDIYGKAVITDSVFIFGRISIRGEVHIHEKVWITGDVKLTQTLSPIKLYGQTNLNGYSVILGGDFLNTPLQIQGSKDFFNVSSSRTCNIGSRIIDLKSSLRRYKQALKKKNYTSREIKEYIKYFKLVRIKRSWF